MKTTILMAGLLVLGTLCVTPGAVAPYCQFPEVTVDEVQACGNYVIDLGQDVGGWGVNEACELAFGEENCD